MRKLIAIFTSITPLFLFPASTLAVTVNPEDTEIFKILVRIINLLQKGVVPIVFILAVIAFGWGIVKLIASAGNPQETKNAKNIIFWSIIGIAVIASITGIIIYIQKFLLIDTSNNTLKPPQF